MNGRRVAQGFSRLNAQQEGKPVDDEGPAIVRCPIHGIAYDEELEDCPECAKGGFTLARPSASVTHEG